MYINWLYTYLNYSRFLFSKFFLLFLVSVFLPFMLLSYLPRGLEICLFLCVLLLLFQQPPSLTTFCSIFFNHLRHHLHILFNSSKPVGKMYNPTKHYEHNNIKIVYVQPGLWKSILWVQSALSYTVVNIFSSKSGVPFLWISAECPFNSAVVVTLLLLVQYK